MATKTASKRKQGVGRGQGAGSKKTRFNGKPGPGRPLGSSTLKTIMDEAGITVENEVDRLLLVYAVAKNPKHRHFAWANDYISDRRYGKATQPIANDSDSPVTFVINTNLPGFVNGKHKRSQNS